MTPIVGALALSGAPSRVTVTARILGRYTPDGLAAPDYVGYYEAGAYSTPGGGQYELPCAAEPGDIVPRAQIALCVEYPDRPPVVDFWTIDLVAVGGVLDLSVPQMPVPILMGTPTPPGGGTPSPGPIGADGIGLYLVSGIPSAGFGRPGEGAIDYASPTLDLYQKVGGAWVKRAEVRGVAGQNGTGAKGDKGDPGRGLPNVTIADIGKVPIAMATTGTQYELADPATILQASLSKLADVPTLPPSVGVSLYFAPATDVLPARWTWAFIARKADELSFSFNQDGPAHKKIARDIVLAAVDVGSPGTPTVEIAYASDPGEPFVVHDFDAGTLALTTGDYVRVSVAGLAADEWAAVNLLEQLPAVIG